MQGACRPVLTNVKPVTVRTARVWVIIATVAVGHILGTSRRDLPRTDENRRDLSRRSEHMRDAFTMVRETSAQDPAHRPTCQDHLPT
jgi:hypothetical protein